ncbi:hypothetical protein Glove_91g91 [Diversispora epigaea]|uniref:Uncharacterized protein n=1 Tax=Diversispora epigaea TaxID=1348612 RepID=A0A397JG04_9GLOM|nr:hypothetical protein Glove_91g91 [Diversispora epigaea]
MELTGFLGTWNVGSRHPKVVYQEFFCIHPECRKYRMKKFCKVIFTASRFSSDRSSEFLGINAVSGVK